MKWVVAALLLMFLGLQYRLWVGDGSLSEVVQLQAELNQQKQKVSELQKRNTALSDRVIELQTNPSAIEEVARKELGMIKQGEVFYQLIEPKANHSKNLQDNSNE